MRLRSMTTVLSGLCGFSGLPLQADRLREGFMRRSAVLALVFEHWGTFAVHNGGGRTVTFKFLLAFGHVLFLFTLLLTDSALAAVINQQEWSSKPGWPWSYTAGKPSIDNTTNSPSGGGALRFTFEAGTYSSSTSGGTATFETLGHTDLYVGHWMKWSSPFNWNPVGTKIDYLTMSDPNANGNRDNFLFMVQDNGNTLTFTQQLWAAPGTQNRNANISSQTFQLNRWYWFEFHVRLNTVGQANGLLEAWVDNKLVMSHNNVTYRTYNSTWGNFSHATVWGGGGGTISQQQYFWVDHTVISTTRIGMPGGGPAGDSTAPTSPSGIAVQ